MTSAAELNAFAMALETLSDGAVAFMFANETNDDRREVIRQTLATRNENQITEIAKTVRSFEPKD